ncbi:UNVERIFIED_CONTAM: hypothetical protein FKN15_057251 [Acipenser sinensis]
MWSGVGGTGRMGSGVEGTGRMWSRVGGTGRMGSGVEGTGRMGSGVEGTGRMWSRVGGTGRMGSGVEGTGRMGSGVEGTGRMGSGVGGTGWGAEWEEGERSGRDWEDVEQSGRDWEDGERSGRDWEDGERSGRDWMGSGVGGRGAEWEGLGGWEVEWEGLGGWGAEWEGLGECGGSGRDRESAGVLGGTGRVQGFWDGLGECGGSGRDRESARVLGGTGRVRGFWEGLSCVAGQVSDCPFSLSAVDFLRSLFARMQGLGSGPVEQVLDELSLEGMARYMQSGDCEYRTGPGRNLQKYDLPCPEAIFEIGYFKQHPEPFFTLARELYPGQFKTSCFSGRVFLLASPPPCARVPPKTPRLLINREKTGEVRMRVQGVDSYCTAVSPSPGFTTSLMSTTVYVGNKLRDVVFLGSCDDGCLALAEMLGWKVFIIIIIIICQMPLSKATHTGVTMQAPYLNTVWFTPRLPPLKTSPALDGVVPQPVLLDTLPESLDLQLLGQEIKPEPHQTEFLTWSPALFFLKPQMSRRSWATSLGLPLPFAVLPLVAQTSLRRGQASNLCLLLLLKDHCLFYVVN